MVKFINFGDVFRYQDKEYIYLQGTDKVTYAAWILPKQETSELEKLSNKISSDPIKKQRLKEDPFYCYVVLQTKEFKERAAHCGKSANEPMKLDSLIDIKLDKKDLLSIKKEIMEGPVNSELKDLVKDIEI